MIHGRIQRSISLKERGHIVCWREAWPCKSWMTCVLLPLLLAGCSCHPLDLNFLNYNLDWMICIYLESFCWAAGSYGNVFATKSPYTYLTSLWLLGIIFWERHHFMEVWCNFLVIKQSQKSGLAFVNPLLFPLLSPPYRALTSSCCHALLSLFSSTNQKWPLLPSSVLDVWTLLWITRLSYSSGPWLSGLPL